MKIISAVLLSFLVSLQGMSKEKNSAPVDACEQIAWDTATFLEQSSWSKTSVNARTLRTKDISSSGGMYVVEVTNSRGVNVSGYSYYLYTSADSASGVCHVYRVSTQDDSVQG
ncbi:MAG: hypothetical protein ACXWQO_18625 [Bdellovibrionota bacterium]